MIFTCKSTLYWLAVNLHFINLLNKLLSTTICKHSYLANENIWVTLYFCKYWIVKFKLFWLKKTVKNLIISYMLIVVNCTVNMILEYICRQILWIGPTFKDNNTQNQSSCFFLTNTETHCSHDKRLKQKALCNTTQCQRSLKITTSHLSNLC